MFDKDGVVFCETNSRMVAGRPPRQRAVRGNHQRRKIVRGICIDRSFMNERLVVAGNDLPATTPCHAKDLFPRVRLLQHSFFRMLLWGRGLATSLEVRSD